MAEIEEGTITQAQSEMTYCEVHPTVETSLRCNKCGRLMCTKCAVHTPVGYRCKECVRGQQQIFFNAKVTDLLLQGVISIVLTALATGIIGSFLFGIGFFSLLIAFFLGSAVGGGIGDLAYRAAGRRRGRYSWLIVAGAIGLGALLGGVFTRLSLPWLIFTGFAISGVIGRLRLGK